MRFHHKLFHYLDPIFIAITVSFSRSTYSVDEDDGVVGPQLVLSNPSSTDITVQVRDIQIAATGE